ncbi:MAG: hypothetical protein OES79_00250 [Planctomycetota bacterium]|nr:hypothetical protein [Planctomycetota bacterium]
MANALPPVYQPARYEPLTYQPVTVQPVTYQAPVRHYTRCWDYRLPDELDTGWRSVAR